MSKLDEIKARLKKATPGPWTLRPSRFGVNYPAQINGPKFTSKRSAMGNGYLSFGFSKNEDADFIAQSRTDIELLIQVVELQNEALTVIAATHLEPFCPELFDSPIDVCVQDTMCARKAIFQVKVLFDEHPEEVKE